MPVKVRHHRGCRPAAGDVALHWPVTASVESAWRCCRNTPCNLILYCLLLDGVWSLPGVGSRLRWAPSAAGPLQQFSAGCPLFQCSLAAGTASVTAPAKVTTKSHKRPAVVFAHMHSNFGTPWASQSAERLLERRHAPTCDQEPGAAHRSTTCCTPARDGSTHLRHRLSGHLSPANADNCPSMTHGDISYTWWPLTALKDVKRLIDLKQLEGTARPPALLLCFPVENVPLVLRYRSLRKLA